jgi:hypothetical protein
MQGDGMIVWAVIGVVVVIVLGLLLWGYWTTQRPSLDEARRQFQQRREYLEARFFTLAASSGKPRGLRWVECEWESPVTYARDRRSGQLAAFVAITIRFEAIEGSDMEGLPAVGNLRTASAVFFHDRGEWLASGRALFNLEPAQAIHHFGGQYELIEGN